MLNLVQLHPPLLFHQPNHQLFVGLWWDDFFLPLLHLYRTAGTEVGADAASQAELFIHHRIIPLHSDGLDLTTVFALLAAVAFIKLRFGNEICCGNSVF